MYKSILKAVAVSAVAAFFCVGCGGDNGGGPSLNSELVCADGEAWVSTYTLNSGSIFYRNGELIDIKKSGGSWYFVSYESQNLKSITWSASGGKIIYHATAMDGRVVDIDGTYSISGNTLYVTMGGQSGSFTKQTGIYPIVEGGGGPVDPPDNPGGGGNWKWTAVADSTIWYEGTYTYNGATYSTYTDVKAIAYGGGRWVAVGEKGKMAYSANGASWTVVTNSTFGNDIDIEAIAYGGGRFVAVGEEGKMAYSTDGASWTAVANSPFGSMFNINAIAYGSNKFVAASNRIAYSTDGTSWTTVPSENEGGLGIIHGIAWGNNRFVAVGNAGRMAYSADGTSWTAVANSSFGDNEIHAVAYGNNRWAAVGAWDDVGPNTNATIGTMAYSTDNGVTWTAVPRNSTFNTGADITAIAFGNGRFVAGCYGGKTAYSTDGVSWTTESKIMLEINGIAYGNGRFIAVGGNLAVGKNGPIAYADW